MELNRQSLSIREGLTEEGIGEELFIHDQQSGAIHILNQGASMVWLLCDGIKDMVDIAAEIAAWSVSPVPDVLGEVGRTVAEFEKLGLLKGREQDSKSGSRRWKRALGKLRRAKSR